MMNQARFLSEKFDKVSSVKNITLEELLELSAELDRVILDNYYDEYEDVKYPDTYLQA